MRWDAGHYMRIASEGYGSAIDDTTAFFPVFPWLAKPLMFVMSPDWACVVAGSVTGLIAVFALFDYWRLAPDAGAIVSGHDTRPKPGEAVESS